MKKTEVKYKILTCNIYMFVERAFVVVELGRTVVDAADVVEVVGGAVVAAAAEKFVAVDSSSVEPGAVAAENNSAAPVY